MLWPKAKAFFNMRKEREKERERKRERKRERERERKREGVCVRQTQKIYVRLGVRNEGPTNR